MTLNSLRNTLITLFSKRATGNGYLWARRIFMQQTFTLHHDLQRYGMRTNNICKLNDSITYIVRTSIIIIIIVMYALENNFPTL